tara:strand:+ start:128 stop:1081 length:954 start_codon:yes stop_codon:yes gene_type:complete
MSILLHGDCLDELKSVDDESIDLIFCDLPYGQTSCKWDCKIDLDKLWIELIRVKKLNTPIFFTTTTKFGVSLIQSAPKKCFFRYDLVWVKSSSAGFLSAKKMPMRKHELIYVFYEKLPFYDLSSHKHKFIDKKDAVDVKDSAYGSLKIKQPKTAGSRYDPPLPDSVIIKEKHNNHIKDGQIYNSGKGMKVISDGKGHQYDPPLPHSVIKDTKLGTNTYDTEKRKKPILRLSDQQQYDPPLPNSLLEIKSTRRNHSTEKPVALMEWILKYYSKEGDVILDPTMGSGSMGAAAKNMNRNFIGIEKDPEIYEVAVNRIEN